VNHLRELKPFALCISKAPDEMTNDEATAEFDELMSTIDESLSYFLAVLRECGIESTTSAEVTVRNAGEWVVQRGALIKAPSPGPSWTSSDVDDTNLSLATKSACCYLGLLFADTILKEVPGSTWELVTEDRKDIDYHRPVIRSEACQAQLDPFRVAMNFVHARLEGSSSDSLDTIYLIWRSALSGQRE